MSSSENEMDCDDIIDLDDFTGSDESDGESEYSEYSEKSDDTSENDPEENFEMPWTSNGIPRSVFPFTANSGVQVNNLNSVLQIFENFFDNNIIDLIVTETNRFAIQYIAKNSETIKQQSRVRKWKQTDSNEIRTLIGLLILQGVCPKPEYKMYFSRRQSIETPFFPRIITEKKISLVTEIFALCRQFDYKLAKVLPFLDHLRNKFTTSYMPEKLIAIDESLIGWKGRLGWKQYIPSKRKQFGIKLFALCESSSGYMFNFTIYNGSGTDYGTKYCKEPITSRIVLSLIDHLLDKGYRLFLDNYYTSIDLIDKLVKRRTDCVGTMRINRKGIPKDLKTKLSKGKTIARYRRKNNDSKMARQEGRFDD
ncbi:hypothetical protein NQ314_005373 [Rhamnusium bicolor]|uniref:PiggyBac transposable element-derived protein domain-containing protein n=1 Tax=Rhamnusium bicolor TaxID=1586634 RepID=A0AAV8ZGN5_9CUCU|nr:hypothetical protein NQ314_005373 [Rhamnusium bicolor]